MNYPEEGGQFDQSQPDYYSQEEESNEPLIVDYGDQFARARYTNNQAERSIGHLARDKDYAHKYVEWHVTEGNLNPTELRRIAKEKRELAIGIHTYAELKTTYPFIDTKASSDLGIEFANLPFVSIVDEDMEKLAHEVELGNSITPLGQEQRAAAYGFMEQHQDIAALTLQDFQDINGVLAPCVIPNLISSNNLKRIAVELGYTPERGQDYTVRRRKDFTEALERAMQRNIQIEEYVESGEIPPQVAIAFGYALQEFSCIRPKVTTRVNNQTTNYSPTEIIHKFFKKGGMYIAQGLPLLHIAATQNEIARSFFDPSMYKSASKATHVPHGRRLDTLNGRIAPCVIANLITGVRIVELGEQMLKPKLS